MVDPVAMQLSGAFRGLFQSRLHLAGGPQMGSRPSSTWWETGSPRCESQKVVRYAIARDIGTTTPSAARLPSQNAAQSAIIVRRFDRADIGLDGDGAIAVLRNRA
jgi:hypothetical protein